MEELIHEKGNYSSEEFDELGIIFFILVGFDVLDEFSYLLK